MPTVEDVIDILGRVAENGAEIKPETELLESGILDSLAFILLFSELEDLGADIQPTQIEKSEFSTPAAIAKLAGFGTETEKTTNQNKNYATA